MADRQRGLGLPSGRLSRQTSRHVPLEDEEDVPQQGSAAGGEAAPALASSAPPTTATTLQSNLASISSGVGSKLLSFAIGLFLGIVVLSFRAGGGATTTPWGALVGAPLGAAAVGHSTAAGSSAPAWHDPPAALPSPAAWNWGGSSDTDVGAQGSGSEGGGAPGTSGEAFSGGAGYEPSSTFVDIPGLDDGALNPCLAAGTCSKVQLAAWANKSPIKEVALAITDSRALVTVDFWIDRAKVLNVRNFILIALDDGVMEWCGTKGITANCVREDIPEEILRVAAGRHFREIVSAAKYSFVSDVLAMGVHVLLTDTDMALLDNPFCALHRDSDIEAMSDGWDAPTLYGGIYVLDDEVRRASLRFWQIVFLNAGFVYIRSSKPGRAVLAETAAMLRTINMWDQAALNFATLLPLHDPDDPTAVTFGGHGATLRVIDPRRASNSKVVYLYKNDFFLPRTPGGPPVCPMVVHINYHGGGNAGEKLQRAHDVMESGSMFRHCVKNEDRSVCSNEAVVPEPFV